MQQKQEVEASSVWYVFVFTQRTKMKAQNYELYLWIVGIVGNWRSSELEKKRVIVSLQPRVKLGKKSWDGGRVAHAPLAYLPIHLKGIPSNSKHCKRSNLYSHRIYWDLDINVISFSTKMVLVKWINCKVQCAFNIPISEFRSNLFLNLFQFF